jgi:hypothetical protein
MGDIQGPAPHAPAGFNPVILALFSITVMCGIFIGFNEKALPPVAAGLGFLLWGALPHAICMYESVRQGHTEASVVLMLFLGFWLFLGIGLLVAPPADLVAVLRYAEPVIALAVFIMCVYYRRTPSLSRILIGLGVTVSWLWASKLIHAPAFIASWIVGILGCFVFLTAIVQLNQHQRRALQSAVRSEG